MKVILTQDVARLGRQSEIKDVPSGHALNFLIPRKLAIPATPENLKRHESTMSKKANEKAEHVAALGNVFQALAGQTVTHKVSANEKGHLFSGVSVDTIVEILKEAGHVVDKNVIVLEHPIKELGKFPVVLKEGDQKAEFILELVNEK